MEIKAGFQLREIFRCRKFSLSFFSIVSDHAQLMFKIQKKTCKIFRQRNISCNLKSRLIISLRLFPSFTLKPGPHCDISVRSRTFDVHKHKHKKMKTLRSFLCLRLCTSKVPFLALACVVSEDQA